VISARMSLIAAVALLSYADAFAEYDKSPKWGAWIPENEGWRKRMDYREQQVIRIEDTQERWDAFLNLAVSGLMVPQFTEKGWKVVKQPPSVHARLNASLHEGFRRSQQGESQKEDDEHEDARAKIGIFHKDKTNKLNREHKVDQITGDRLPGFVPLGRLTGDLLKELQPMHEAWAGNIKLVPSNAYGLRVYERGNSLTMHTDHVGTHVISSIVHVDRDTDEPWPIVIEGLDGQTQEVDLKPGEMLFYESAKCVHGRPRPLNGNWYSSLFVHYRPATWDIDTADAIKVVEPVFHESLSEEGAARMKRDPPAGETDFQPLRMRGTGFREPGCEHEWCELNKVWPPLGGAPDMVEEDIDEL